MKLRYTLYNSVEGEYVTTYSPAGWEETELVFRRHDNYDGIFWDYTVKLDFFCGAGKEYIDRIKEREGIDGELFVRIEMDCGETGDYELLYYGKGVFKTYEITQGAPEFTRINLEETGVIFTVLNRLETKVDLTKLETLDGEPLSQLPFAPYDLTTHSKMLIEEGIGNFAGNTNEWVFEGNDTDNIDVSYSGGGHRTLENSFSQTIIPENLIINELRGYSFSPNSLFRDNTYPANNIQAQSDNLYSNLRAGTYNISGKLKFGVYITGLVVGAAGDIGGDRTFELFLTPHLYLQTGSVVTHLETKPEIYKFTSFNMGNNVQVLLPITELTFEFSKTGIILNEDDNIRIYLKFDSKRVLQRPQFEGAIYDIDITQASFFNVNFDDETKSYISVQYESIGEDSTTKAFAVFETGADIARKITGQSDSFRSNYFGRTNSSPKSYADNGCGAFTAFTNGFQLRGFPLEEHPVYMSMKEYFDGLNAIHCLGLGLKQEGDNTYIEVEPKDYFYRNDEVVLTLNNVRNLSTKYDERYFFNRFKIGFKDWRKEGLNGLDEFCTTHDYATLLKSVNNELIAQSDFIAAPYALERQRRQRYEDTATTDEDYDNNNFIIALNRSVDGNNIPTKLDEAEKDENFTAIENVFSPNTIYNLRFSPARSARNWFKILATSLIKLNDTLKTIRFTFAEGNKTMVSKGAEPCDPAKQSIVSEGEDLVIDVPNANNDFEPLFTGEIDSIEEYPLSFASYLHLKALDSNGIPNYYKMVRYSKGESDYLFGYIQEIRYKPITGMASFKFKRAYNRDVDCSHIYVEAGYVECGYVE